MKNKKRNEIEDGLSKTPYLEICEREISFRVTAKEYSKWSQENNVTKKDWFTVAKCGIDRIGIKIPNGYSLMKFKRNDKWDNYDITIVPLI